MLTKENKMQNVQKQFFDSIWWLLKRTRQIMFKLARILKVWAARWRGQDGSDLRRAEGEDFHLFTQFGDCDFRSYNIPHASHPLFPPIKMFCEIKATSIISTTFSPTECPLMYKIMELVLYTHYVAKSGKCPFIVFTAGNVKNRPLLYLLQETWKMARSVFKPTTSRK